MNLQLKDKEVQRALMDDRITRYRREAQAHRAVQEMKQSTTPSRFTLVVWLKRLFTKTEAPNQELPSQKEIAQAET